MNKKGTCMHLSFWRPSLVGRGAAKRLVASAGVLALVVGLLTASMLYSRPAATGQIHPPTAGLHPSTTVQTLDHQSLVPRFDTFARGSDGMLWHKWWKDGYWYDW